MTEFELKFQVPAERMEALEVALRRGPVQVQRLRARYFDTADEALARHGLVLRLRQEGRAWVQAAKGPGRGGFERLEHEVPRPDGKGPPEIGLHAAHPLGKLLRKALHDTQQPLVPVYETDIQRCTRVVEAAGTAVEIALDRGRIRAGKRSQPVQEIEFELKQGSAAAAVELARGWCEQHGLWLDPVSKAEQGHRLAAGGHEAEATHAAPVPGRPGSSNALLAALLDSGTRQVLRNARELAALRGGDEHVHQLRIGLRRLRTALRELQALPPLQALDLATEAALRELFGVLGQHRDRRTLLPQLEDEMARAGGPALRGWQPELPDLAAAVRAPAFQAAMLNLVALAQQLHDAPEGAGLAPLRKLAAARLQKLLQQVRHGGRHFLRLPQEQRHTVRKRLKRLRYLAELLRPLFAARDVDRFVKQLKPLQDALGAYQDAATARALFEQHVQQDPAAWFAIGWLAAREREIAAHCERACRHWNENARAFWR